MQETLLLRLQLAHVKLAYIDQGQGEPLVFVHGSWDDHHSWDAVTSSLGGNYRTITYDRRGHSASTSIAQQGSVLEDISDALELIETLNLHNVHLVGHSYGATIALAAAAFRPESIKSVFVHEPPLFSILNKTDAEKELVRQYTERMTQAAAMIEAGEIEKAARLFFEKVAFGAGSWHTLFDESARRTALINADTWLDQYRDPDRLALNLNNLSNFKGAITISAGSQSLPIYPQVAKRIAESYPRVRIEAIAGAGHAAHISHPKQFAALLKKHLST